MKAIFSVKRMIERRITMFTWTKKTSVSRHSAPLQRRARSFPSLLVVLSLVLSLALAPAAFAAPSAAKLEAKYVKTLTKLLPETQAGIDYMLIDMDKDGMNECLALYKDSTSGSGSNFELYDYTSGKVKKRLSLGQYGLSKVTYYPTTNSLILYGSGHGGEWYRYYTKNSKGTYKMKVMRARTAVAGGAEENGPYSYYDKKEEKITKSAFKKSVKKIEKGSKKTYKLYGSSYTWKHLDK